MTNTTSVKEIYNGSPQESGSVHFETTRECHVALDVHVILQKWNSYHIVSTLYHGLPENLAETFEELNFCGAGRIHEKRENYAPRNLVLYGSRHLETFAWLDGCVHS